MRDGKPFAFAGPVGRVVAKGRARGHPRAAHLHHPHRQPNALVAQIHNRQAVILSRENYAAWHSPDTSDDDRRAMLRPYPAELMRAHPISTRVNKSGNDDDATLIKEVALATALPTRPVKAKPDDRQGDLF